MYTLGWKYEKYPYGIFLFVCLQRYFVVCKDMISNLHYECTLYDFALGILKVISVIAKVKLTGIGKVDKK